MSGIAGIFNRDGRPTDPALLGKMGARLKHRGPDGEFRRIQGSVGMVCQLNRITPESVNEIQPLTDPSGTMLVFDGRLDNREDLLALLRANREISTASSDPDLVLAAYQVYGEQLPERLNGDFAFAIFDPRERKLMLVRDPLGVRPLHYARSGDFLIFASEIKALLAHPAIRPQPNDDLLADCLLGQVYDQEITFFKDIFSVVPSHIVVSTPKGLVKRRYWDFDPEARIRFSSFPEYAQAFREVFERSVRRRLRSRHPVTVSLSGGLDSSSIYCMAESLSRSASGIPKIIGASCISKDGTSSDEKAFLLDIEKMYGTSIHRFPISYSGFLNGAEKVTWHIEMPMSDGLWDNLDNFFLEMMRQKSRVQLTGHWGDQFLFSQAYLVDLFRGLKWVMAMSHLREFGRWMTDADPGQFRGRFIQDLLKQYSPGAAFPILRKLRARYKHPWFSESLQTLAGRREWKRGRLGTQFRSAQARSLYEEARTGYHVLCMDWHNKLGSVYGLETNFPFLDRDLISFLMAIPGEIQTYQGVPKGLLRESMRGILPEPIAERRWKADATYFTNEAIKIDYDRLNKLIMSGQAHARNYFNKKGLQEELDLLRSMISNSTAEPAWGLGDIINLETWLNVFFAEENLNRKAADGEVQEFADAR